MSDFCACVFETTFDLQPCVLLYCYRGLRFAAYAASGGHSSHLLTPHTLEYNLCSSSGSLQVVCVGRCEGETQRGEGNEVVWYTSESGSGLPGSSPATEDRAQREESGRGRHGHLILAGSAPLNNPLPL